MSDNLTGAHVLVIGASGFVGGRLVERLVLEQRARVRVLVRRIMSAAPLTRFALEVIGGDVLDERVVAAAADGCAVVFNCAKGKGPDAALRRAVDVDGVRNVLAAARRTGARVVHVSTMAVYGGSRDDDITERSPDAPRGDAYVDGKLAGERLALELGTRDAVPVAVIQPSVVYGPNAGVYGSEIIDELRTHRMILVDGGAGICNAVYVDDVVTALLLAATSDRAAGERFLVTGPEYPTWREFVGTFERMLNVQRTVSLSEAEALRVWRQSRHRAWLGVELLRVLREDRALRRRLLATREGIVVRRIAERLVPASVLARARGPQPRDTESPPDAEPPLAPVRPWAVRFVARTARVRIDKARSVLGYEPVFRLADGMRLTSDWARWAGLLS